MLRLRVGKQQDETRHDTTRHEARGETEKRGGGGPNTMDHGPLAMGSQHQLPEEEGKGKRKGREGKKGKLY